MVIGITNGRIRDLASFDQVTGSPWQVAGVYFYALLDPLIELAHGIARDFFSRPHLYTDMGDPKVVEDLARRAARYGTHERVPSCEQRVAIYGPLFTGPGAPAKFAQQLRPAREHTNRGPGAPT